MIFVYLATPCKTEELRNLLFCHSQLILLICVISLMLGPRLRVSFQTNRLM